MKDRIREIMESQHMNQQSFAAFIGIAPASLNGMLQERTRPTLNIVEAIVKKIPSINLTWLFSGKGSMYITVSSGDKQDSVSDYTKTDFTERVIDFGGTLNDSPALPANNANAGEVQRQKQRSSSSDNTVIEVKKVDKIYRQITEIRVFYDDQTWESFVPKK